VHRLKRPQRSHWWRIASRVLRRADPRAFAFTSSRASFCPRVFCGGGERQQFLHTGQLPQRKNDKRDAVDVSYSIIFAGATFPGAVSKRNTKYGSPESPCQRRANARSKSPPARAGS